MSANDPGQPEREPTEEELRAAYEQQLKQIRVDDVLVQTVLSLINLGSLRAGLVPGNEAEADAPQLRQAIEGVRALLPLVEPTLGATADRGPRAGAEQRPALGSRALSQSTRPPHRLPAADLDRVRAL